MTAPAVICRTVLTTAAVMDPPMATAIRTTFGQQTPMSSTTSRTAVGTVRTIKESVPMPSLLGVFGILNYTKIHSIDY